MAAGADKEAKYMVEVGGGVTGSEGGSAASCVLSEHKLVMALPVCRLASRPSSLPASKATSRWCVHCWQRALTRRPGTGGVVGSRVEER